MVWATLQRTGGQGHRVQPHYSYPPRVIAGLVRDLLLQRPRSFQQDARACIAELRPGLQVLGREHIPSIGPCAITPNHYYRPGFQSQWSTLAISASVPVDVHWIMTGELTFPGHWIAPIGMPVSRVILRGIARVYGFSTMPPMPPRPRDLKARAASVRAILRHVRRVPQGIIALAPEGGDQPGGKLSMPPPGLGRFSLLLADAGLRFVPVGVYECDGRLILNFGPPYDLARAPASTAAEKDVAASETIMRHIAELLPRDLRGPWQ